jgi:hypothetical protein
MPPDHMPRLRSTIVRDWTVPCSWVEGLLTDHLHRQFRPARSLMAGRTDGPLNLAGQRNSAYRHFSLCRAVAQDEIDSLPAISSRIALHSAVCSLHDPLPVIIVSLKVSRPKTVHRLSIRPPPRYRFALQAALRSSLVQ